MNNLPFARKLRAGKQWVNNHPVRAATFAGWLQQGVTGLSAILVIPILLKNLGAESTGVWLSFQGFECRHGSPIPAQNHHGKRRYRAGVVDSPVEGLKQYWNGFPKLRPLASRLPVSFQMRAQKGFFANWCGVWSGRSEHPVSFKTLVITDKQRALRETGCRPLSGSAAKLASAARTFCFQCFPAEFPLHSGFKSHTNSRRAAKTHYTKTSIFVIDDLRIRNCSFRVFCARIFPRIFYW